MLKTSGPWRACPLIAAVQTAGNLSLGEPMRLEQHWDFEGDAGQVLRKSGNNPYPGQVSLPHASCSPSSGFHWALVRVTSSW